VFVLCCLLYKERSCDEPSRAEPSRAEPHLGSAKKAAQLTIIVTIINSDQFDVTSFPHMH
jgi:hypothetical protein